MKILSVILLSLFLISACSSHQEQTVHNQSGGIVPKPESSDVRRPGEKLNMMLLMDMEAAAEEMDEVIVIPPKEKEKGTNNNQ